MFLDALIKIKDEIDPTLSFRRSCSRASYPFLKVITKDKLAMMTMKAREQAMKAMKAILIALMWALGGLGL